MRKLSIS